MLIIVNNMIHIFWNASYYSRAFEIIHLESSSKKILIYVRVAAHFSEKKDRTLLVNLIKDYYEWLVEQKACFSCYSQKALLTWQ